MNWKKAGIALIAFIGVGSVGYLVQLVHADQHGNDRTKVEQLERQTNSLVQIVNSNMLTEELMRAARLKQQLEVEDDPSVLKQLIKTEQNIERLRAALNP